MNCGEDNNFGSKALIRRQVTLSEKMLLSIKKLFVGWIKLVTAEK